MPGKRQLAGLYLLCSMDLHVEALVGAWLEALHDVIPSRRNLFDWANDDGRLQRWLVEGPVDAAAARRYFERYHNRAEEAWMPAFRTLAAQPVGVRGAGELTHPGFVDSGLYQEVWRPQGLRSRIEGVLRGARGQLLGSLVLYRGPDDTPYNRADERTLQALLPLLARALESAMARPVPPAHAHAAAAAEREALLLTADGEVLQATAGAHRLLLLMHHGMTPGAVEQPLAQLATQVLAPLVRRLPELTGASGYCATARPPSMTWLNAYGRFDAHAQPAWPQQAPDLQWAPTPTAWVTLVRAEPAQVAMARSLRELPITLGQMQVCTAVHEGLAYGEIAARLGVARSTVVDHVRKACVTLEAGGSADLRWLLERRLQAAPSATWARAGAQPTAEPDTPAMPA